MFYTALHKKFFIKDFFCKCDQIRSFLRIWSHLLKKSLMENFIFCALLTICSCLVKFRSSPSKVFLGKGVLKNVQQVYRTTPMPKWMAASVKFIFIMTILFMIQLLTIIFSKKLNSYNIT